MAMAKLRNSGVSTAAQLKVDEGNDDTNCIIKPYSDAYLSNINTKNITTATGAKPPILPTSSTTGNIISNNNTNNTAYKR